MKFRISFIVILATLLSACNFTLAEDVTPPPGYVSPTPLPTLALVPERTPNTANGAAIYAVKCAPCHGSTGMGDGEKGIQLGVTVPAFGLPDVARPLSPEQIYTVVTRGNMERFMPPFASLSDQERWDVTSYVLTLHTSQDQVQKGKDLFQANCANCSTDFFKNQKNMSAISTVELARIVRLGNDQIKPFGEKLSDDDMWAVAEYLRSLSFDETPLAQPTVAPATQTPVAAEASTPSAEGTPVETTPQAQVTSEATTVTQQGAGTITGSVDNKTGETLPADTPVTLHGYDHNTQDPNNAQAPQEVLTLHGTLAADGTFVFNNVDMPANRFFTAEIMYDGVGIESDITTVSEGQTSLNLPPIVLYKTTNDTSTLVVDQLHIFIDASSDTSYEVMALYTFHNSSQMIVAVPMGNQQEIPFLKFPTGSQALGYQAMQNSAALVSTNDGFAIPPNDNSYGILAFASVPRIKETSIAQPLVLPVSSVSIFVPDGLELQGSNLEKGAPQDIQGTLYQAYSAGSLKAGEDLKFTITGSPKSGTSTSSNDLSRNLLIGAGVLGLVLILLGGWMYFRDRNRTQNDSDDGEDEFESADDVMDAIITLDDLHRAKKISDEAYQKRRAELKEILKGKM